jgi:hypothetical protein
VDKLVEREREPAAIDALFDRLTMLEQLGRPDQPEARPIANAQPVK